MSRKFDISIGEFYHIYNRGTEKRKIFLTPDDYERFQALLYIANATKPIHLSDYPHLHHFELFSLKRDETLTDIGAYCLMPNHFHLLLKEKRENGISLFMQKLLTGYSMYFNKKKHHTGTLFESSFKARHLNEDNDLKYQYAYIHLNPIGIIDDGWKEKKISDKDRVKTFLSSYSYSSYLDYARENDRSESAILEKSAFPEYFLTFTEFNSMIEEWINFEEL